MQAELSRLIPRKLAANLELSNCSFSRFLLRFMFLRSRWFADSHADLFQTCAFFHRSLRGTKRLVSKQRSACGRGKGDRVNSARKLLASDNGKRPAGCKIRNTELSHSSECDWLGAALFSASAILHVRHTEIHNGLDLQQPCLKSVIMTRAVRCALSGAASPFFPRHKYVDFKRATVFCLGHCLSKHKMARHAWNFFFGGHGPSGCAYVCAWRHNFFLQRILVLDLCPAQEWRLYCKSSARKMMGVTCMGFLCTRTRRKLSQCVWLFVTVRLIVCRMFTAFTASGNFKAFRHVVCSRAVRTKLWSAAHVRAHNNLCPVKLLSGKSRGGSSQ